MIMAAPSVLGELIPCGGGDPIPLLKPKLLVGRRSHCDIQLQFPNISSHHCELEWVNGFWRVLDLNSSNGIKVNGVRVETKWLMPADVLSVGKHRYEVVYMPEGQCPPEEDEDPFARSLMEKAGLVTTEKDWVRLSPNWRAKVTPWPIKAVFDDPAALAALMDLVVAKANHSQTPGR